MKLFQFEVSIPNGREVNDGYVAMSHGTQYALHLRNYGCRDVDTEVFVDGKLVGEWRVRRNSSAEIQHPVHENGRFTFYRAGSDEGRSIGLDAQDSDLGLVRVVFKPELDRRLLRSGRASLAELGAGGTGLSGESAQRFTSVPRLNTNSKEYVTINLRLGDDSLPRPLFATSTPVPPPLSLYHNRLTSK